MVLRGKLVGQIEIISDGDVFHEIFRHRPHHISDMSPEKVQSVELHDDEWGKPGSIIYWNFTHEEKGKEKKKSVTFNVIEGDIADLYKIFKSTVHVETNGEINVVTWTVECERKKEDAPDPISYLQFVLHLTRDIEAHYLK